MIPINSLSKATVLLNRAITIRATTIRIAAPLPTHHNSSQDIMTLTSSTGLLSNKVITTLSKAMALSNMANLVPQAVLQTANAASAPHSLEVLAARSSATSSVVGRSEL